MMYLTLILAVVFFVIFLIWGIATYGTDNLGEMISTLIFGSLLFGGILSFVSTAYHRNQLGYEYKEVQLGKQPLVALQDNRDISGRGDMMLFVGTMTIDQEPYYYYMVETGLGIQMKKERVERVFIKEGDYEPMMVLEATEKYMSPKYKDKWVYDDESEYINKRTVLYVPTGTIKRDFNIDLQ